MKTTLSIRTVNWLFLVSMLLILTAGSMIQLWNLSFGLVITEVLFILLPVLLVMRKQGIPLKEGLRFRPVSAGVALLCVLMGAGMWTVSLVIEGIMALLTGMPSVAILPEMLPDTVLEGTVYFIALAFFAPLCEEILFRGAVQGAYESKYKVGAAITVTALMFAFFHMRLTGLVALLPVSFLLGYAVWKTQSIWTGMCIHFGMNALAATWTLTLLANPELMNTLTSASEGNKIAVGLALLGGVALGMVILIASLFIFWKRVPTVAQPPLPEDPAVAPVPTPRSAYVPLVLASLVYIAVGILTVFTTMQQAQVKTSLSFTQPELTGPVEYTYRNLNRANEEVGQTICKVEPGQGAVRLSCVKDIEAYDVTIGESRWASGSAHSEWTAAWEQGSFNLLDYTTVEEFEDSASWQAALDPDTHSIMLTGTDQKKSGVDLPENAIADEEWRWRLMFLDWTSSQSWQIPMLYPNRYVEKEQRSMPVVESKQIKVAGNEEVTVPAGTFSTVKVSLDNDEFAWYETGSHRLVKYDDGFQIYELVK